MTSIRLLMLFGLTCLAAVARAVVDRLRRQVASLYTAQVATHRDLAAAQRDLAAAQRDLAAAQRDLAAAQRDLAAAQRDLAARSAELAESRESLAQVRGELHVERQARAHSDERVKLFLATEALRQAGTREQEAAGVDAAAGADVAPAAAKPRNRNARTLQLIAGLLLIVLLLTIAAVAALNGDIFASGAKPSAHSAKPASAARTSAQAVARGAKLFVRCRFSCAFGQTSPAGNRLPGGTVLMPGMSSVLVRLTPIARSEIEMSRKARGTHRAFGTQGPLAAPRSEARVWAPRVTRAPGT